MYKSIHTHTPQFFLSGAKPKPHEHLHTATHMRAHSNTNTDKHARLTNKMSILAWTDRPYKPISGNEMVEEKWRINPWLAERAIHLSFNQTTKWHSNPDTFQDSRRIAASHSMHLNWSSCRWTRAADVWMKWKLWFSFSEFRFRILVCEDNRNKLKTRSFRWIQVVFFL